MQTNRNLRHHHTLVVIVLLFFGCHPGRSSSPSPSPVLLFLGLDSLGQLGLHQVFGQTTHVDQHRLHLGRQVTLNDHFPLFACASATQTGMMQTEINGMIGEVMWWRVRKREEGLSWWVALLVTHIKECYYILTQQGAYIAIAINLYSNRYTSNLIL